MACELTVEVPALLLVLSLFLAPYVQVSRQLVLPLGRGRQPLLVVRLPPRPVSRRRCLVTPAQGVGLLGLALVARGPPCLATLCALALRFELLLVWGEVGGLPVTPGRHAGGTYVHRCTVVVAVPVPVSVPVPAATTTTSHVALVSMCFPGLVPGGVYALCTACRLIKGAGVMHVHLFPDHEP